MNPVEKIRDDTIPHAAEMTMRASRNNLNIVVELRDQREAHTCVREAQLSVDLFHAWKESCTSIQRNIHLNTFRTEIVKYYIQSLKLLDSICGIT